MTLAEFRELTAHLDPATLMHVLLPWGELAVANIISADDLPDGDEAREILRTAEGIVLAGFDEAAAVTLTA